MHYRFSVILVTLLAAIGLSASAALASPKPPRTNSTGCPSGQFGPYNLMTNSDNNLGITYPGSGNQATITLNPGKSCLELLGGATYVIHNLDGNCLRMGGAPQNYAVTEQNGCNTSDNYQRFILIKESGKPYWFQNVATDYFLDVSCPPKDNNKVWGNPNTNGTCIGWQLNNA